MARALAKKISRNIVVSSTGLTFSAWWVLSPKGVAIHKRG